MQNLKVRRMLVDKEFITSQANNDLAVFGRWQVDYAAIVEGIDAMTTCDWSHDSTHSKWDSGCGNGFQFMDGTPRENGFKFCPFCGKELPNDN